MSLMDAAAHALPEGIDALRAALIVARIEVREAEAHAELARAEAAQARAGRSRDQALIAHLKLGVEKLGRELYGQRSERRAPLLTAAAGVALFRSLAKGERAPFLLALALALFALAYLGLGISLFPYIAPPSVTIWNAAAPPSSQGFMLAGAVVIIPVILAYTGWAYWVFRGKVGTGGYH